MLASTPTRRAPGSSGRPGLSALALGLGALLLIGCSADRHTYRSTPTAPKSVSVTYVQSGDTAWSYDIPVGQQLTLKFDRPGQFHGFTSPERPATGMRWYTTATTEGRDLSGHPSKGKSIESGDVALSGELIQINVAKRDASSEAEAVPTLDAVPAPPADAGDVVPAPPAEDTMQDAGDDAMDTMEDAADDAAAAAEDTGDAFEDALNNAADDAEDAAAPALDK